MTTDAAYGKVYSASQLVRTGVGVIYGLTIASHSSGTIKIIDGLTAGAGRILVSTYTLPSGSSVITFPAPITFATGLYIDLQGTTVNYTVHYSEA